MSTVQRKKLLTGPILLSAAKDSVVKLNPVTLMKNPVMFVVEVGTVIVLLMVLAPELLQCGAFGRFQYFGILHPAVHGAVR